MIVKAIRHQSRKIEVSVYIIFVESSHTQIFFLYTAGVHGAYGHSLIRTIAIMLFCAPKWITLL